MGFVFLSLCKTGDPTDHALREAKRCCVVEIYVGLA